MSPRQCTNHLRRIFLSCNQLDLVATVYGLKCGVIWNSKRGGMPKQQEAWAFRRQSDLCLVSGIAAEHILAAVMVKGGCPGLAYCDARLGVR